MSFSNNHSESESNTSGNESSDHEAVESRNTISEIMYKLADLSFTDGYRERNDTITVDIMAFQPWNLSV